MATDIPAFTCVKLPTDEDFEDFRTICTTDDGWGDEVYKDAKYKVWSKKSEGSDLNMVRARTQFDDVEGSILYDVLHDHEYRKTWDDNMIEGYIIQLVNKHTEVGYYSAKMPIGVSNRDFVNLRTWRRDEARGEYIIFNFSVVHKDAPEKKGFVRARSLKTGYFVRNLPEGGCEFIYYSQSDPKGWIPTWVINMLMTSLPPKILGKLHTVALAYPDWKAKHNPDQKPWIDTTEESETPSSSADGEKKKKKKKKEKKEEEDAASDEASNDGEDKK